MNYELFSLLIPIIVIALTIWSKKIISSLIIGIIIGGIFLSKGNIIEGLLTTSNHLVNSVKNEDSIYIILFLFLFGAFGEILKLSGGIKGFTKVTSKLVKREKGALATIYAITPATFIDCCFHDIAAGTVGKALIDKVKGNKRKFAFVLNVTSCLLIILIPFGTTYVGYIIGVVASSIAKTGTNVAPYALYLKSIPFNFYAVFMILLSIFMIIFNFGFKKNIELKRKKNLENSEHDRSEAHEQCKFIEQVPPRPLNLIIPLAFLIITTFFFLWYTGKNQGNSFFNAIANAEFEKSIFISGLITLVITSIFFLFQNVPMKELEHHFLSGGGEMIPPIVVLILSWGLSSIIEDMGFSNLMTGFIGSKVPYFLLPVIIFLIGCLTSYFIGSAWGTWALIMPMAVPLAFATNANLALVIGAVLAGGSLGDNASPLGETAILSSTIADIPLLEHVKSQLPYSFIGIVVSSILFVVFAFI